MKHYRGPRALLTGLLAAVSLVASAAAGARPCESLSTLALPGATITAAQSIPAGSYTASTGAVLANMPPFCRVAGVATPTHASHIKFEVWMPTRGWNGKYLGAGNGGFGGSLATALSKMEPGLKGGYATAGTDMGHDATVEPSGSFALNHEEAMDWIERSIHLTAVNAKAIIAAFYGTGPTLSYFTGCSDGGREGLKEAQKFPEDYDGIVAGAPANFWTRQSFAKMWDWQVTNLDPASYIPEAKLPIISAAAVAACDSRDGVEDGVIEDPRRCDFDPAVLQCVAGVAPTCLTAAQVKAVRKIYAGPHNPRTGEQIFPGLERSSEFNWAILVAGPPMITGADFFRYFLFRDPAFDFRTLNFDGHVALADAEWGGVITSNDPDLTAFRARGGKLILWQGWLDMLVTPRNTINYYESVVRNVAGDRGRKLGSRDDGHAMRETQGFARLFLAPGINHCFGGPGPHFLPSFNTLADVKLLEQWIEQGQAPDRIVATKALPGGAVRTRPLCVYPKVAQWTGSGSTDDAANFVCVNGDRDPNDDDDDHHHRGDHDDD
jgi:feruloyl esterase